VYKTVSKLGRGILSVCTLTKYVEFERDQHMAPPSLPKVTNTSLQIFVIYTFYTCVTFYRYF
jgi:hypothetical protein